MGNVCKCVCRQTDEDEATDALLDGFQSQLTHPDRPRGPPPPYQVEAPLYAMSEEQRVQLVQRVTMIQSLPLGRYDVGDESKEKSEMKVDPSDEVQGHEKKGEKDRECPICMMDFNVGEPIRLLPCMHYYHMRCIDDWLMRSYSCPTCMERVDVGIRHTLSSSSSSAYSGLRRRRRRRERGSTSSLASVLSVGVVDGSGGGAKRREESERQFVPDYVQQARQAVAFPVGQATSGQAAASGQDVSGQIVQVQDEGLSGQAEALPIVTEAGNNHMGYLTDFSTSASGASVNAMGQFTGRHHASIMSSTRSHDHEVQVLNHDSGFVPGRPSRENLAYSMDQVTFPNFTTPERHAYSPQPQGSRYLAPSSPTRPPNARVPSPPFSPPMFECHFEYPTIPSPQHN